MIAHVLEAVGLAFVAFQLGGIFWGLVFVHAGLLGVPAEGCRAPAPAARPKLRTKRALTASTSSQMTAGAGSSPITAPTTPRPTGARR